MKTGSAIFNPFFFEPSEQLAKKSLLWKIEGTMLPAPSYLFGTMHVRDVRVFESLEIVQEKIAACDAFAVEFHIDDMPEGLTGQASLLPGDQSLRDFIPLKKFERLRRVFLKSTGVDLKYFHRLRPFFLVNMLGSRMLQQEMSEPLDLHLWNFAKQEEKELLGIETIAAQFETVNKIPFDAQLKMLLDFGKNISRYRRNVHQLMRLYQKADIYRLYQKTKKSSGGLREPLIYHRNQIMADRIAEIASEKNLFAAIGAGHLAGEKGLIRLLKKKGFSVKAV